MLRVAMIVMTLLTLIFAAVNGVLMCVSPRRHASFLRWYTRVGAQTAGSVSGRQIELRIAGLIITIMSVFFGWVLTGKILSPGMQHEERSLSARADSDSWFNIVAGGFAMMTGVYTIFRTRSVAKWLDRQGVPHTAGMDEFHRQLKIIGVLFILIGVVWLR